MVTESHKWEKKQKYIYLHAADTIPKNNKRIASLSDRLYDGRHGGIKDNSG